MTPAPAVSPHFRPIRFKGNVTVDQLASHPLSAPARELLGTLPRTPCVDRGIPFALTDSLLLVEDKPLTLPLRRLTTRWLVFMHTTDHRDMPLNASGFPSPARGLVHLHVPVADYVLIYADGSEARLTLRHRRHIGMASFPWGEGAFEANGTSDSAPGRLFRWLWAWENPHPRKPIRALRIEPNGWPLFLFAITAGSVTTQPLRWETRRKALLTLPAGTTAESFPLRLDLGQIISQTPRTCYPNDRWSDTLNLDRPEVRHHELLVEYTAHPDACFHLPDGRILPVSTLSNKPTRDRLLTPVKPASQRIRIRVIDRVSRRPVAVRLHVHGEAGEYLTPENRERHIVARDHFMDHGPDFRYSGCHSSTYIDGETVIRLPLGSVYLEVSKGLEIRPIRKTFTITPATRTLTLTLDKVLAWREKGWITADTHVHFLSPSTALLEGAGEGVNVVNLLASQWDEVMTNVGDFDGHTTHGEGTEFMVRVGTENRQPVLGHLSLLGYDGAMVTPLCSGGPSEAAQGDPVEILMLEWAAQCRKQGGLVVLPHFPTPRGEPAAVITEGLADAVEMAHGDPRGGINPYSLGDWYRFLNCGWFVPAVGGTDKMNPYVPVGALRTYARLPAGHPFTHANWLKAVRAGNTFATFGPLIEFTVEGQAPGARVNLGRTGGTVTVNWQVASATIPMTRVELVCGGEIIEGQTIDPEHAQGTWTVRVARSTWLALLVRGRYPDRDEVIAAHTSPVMLPLADTPFAAPADALTILEQIEGTIAYLDTLGTRAETARYKKMRLQLTAAHRHVHNVMHRMGHYHAHTHAKDHKEHH